MKYKINGVYDQITAEFLLTNLNINWIGLDQVPTSSNFIQLYKLKEIIKNYPLTVFTLRYKNEKDFMITHALNDLKEFKEQILLEFTDRKNFSYYEQFRHPYIWTFNDSDHLDEIIKLDYLKIIRIEEEDLKQFQIRGNLFEVLNRIFEFKRLKGIKIELALNWNGQFENSLLDFFEFDLVSFPINSMVETEYRQVNHQLLSKNLRLVINNFFAQGS